jgi:hypothetical protein
MSLKRPEPLHIGDFRQPTQAARRSHPGWRSAPRRHDRVAPPSPSRAHDDGKIVRPTVAPAAIDVSPVRTYINVIMPKSPRAYRILVFAGSLLAGI